MRIDRVTITGADEMTDPAELHAMETHYPFVEWGILFSKSKEATPRYPSQKKITEISSFGLKNLSAHFCGWYSSQVMEANNFKLLEDLQAFNRVQINYNFSKSKDWQVKWIIDWAKEHPEKSIIFQSNGSNLRATSLISSCIISPNIHFLYDSSGGRGLSTAEILPPYRTYTGYSGGLNPDNIRAFMQKVYTNGHPATVWVDMESGVRSENYFDTYKVDEVLSICKEYIES